MKKTLSIIMIVISLTVCLSVLSSCDNMKKDPLALASFFDDNNYYTYISIDDEDIKDVADELKVRAKGITCVVAVQPDNYEDERMGIFIYCESASVAKELFADLETFVQNNQEFTDEIERCIVECSGTLAYIGCEDAWEDMNSGK